MSHTPVLLNESIDLLSPQKGEFFIDGTFGEGGHALAILKLVGKEGKLLAIEWDKNTLDKLIRESHQEFSGEGVIFINDNFARLPEILEEYNLGKADGLILDLGFSSNQLELSGRGFSFNQDEPLLMTYSDDSIPVYRILARINQKDLESIIRDFGEERFAGRVARVIVERNRRGNILKSSKELAELIKNVLPRGYERGRIHPATRTFQALRIFANKELENLETIFKNLDKIIKIGGRVAIISFHSLEDRLVKNYFRDLGKIGKLQVFTKKPIAASDEEIMNNPRSRSAKLRAAKLIS
ncbi:MAG: 16S rRNA (cytosine1402-N4)-methyltransferase [Parcubacteria group bacterium Athens1014_26]|nr:MAG: 16S rRNA (cytosine1402-N4)-methyltransferase [Parcubacteria group bacterium Athens1014_26]